MLVVTSFVGNPSVIPFHILKSIRENMILWVLNIGHSGSLFGMWFLTLSQQLFLLILPSIG
jgi:hypothetical protein